MSITRTFIDWNRPLIPAVVDHLFERHSILGVADLGQVVLAFPSRHGLKRFQDLWARKTRGAGTPPRVITVGDLPELLYQPLRPFASDLVQKLAWGEAVRGLPRQKMEQVLGHLPDEADFNAWLSVGEMLWKTHLELAADGLDFGHVAELGAGLPTFQEQDRWQAMREMQVTYLQTLDQLEMWDLQTARLVAIERGECRTDKSIVLVGAADINIALRRMLDQVADQVTAYIHAPPNLEDRFDSHGCLIPSAWENVDVDLSDDQIAVVDSPDDQAREVVERLRRLDGSRRIDEISIGMPDDRMVPALRRVLGEVDVKCYRAIETTLKETSPYKLLMATVAWLESRRPSQFAELVRHPAISGWLADQGVPSKWLIELDEFLSQHLQSRLGSWPATVAEKFHSLKRAYDLVTALLSTLSGEARLLADWTEPLTEYLLTVYGYREFDWDEADDRLIVETCRRIQQALSENMQVPEVLMPGLAAHQAIRLTLSSMANQTIPPEGQLDGVELLGWLDLAQDDNPVVLLTNFNEHYVPSSVNSHLFLPNALRQHLGITDNARRYARDVHALQALLLSRENVSLIVGRRDIRREPLVPSRLLFATDGRTIAARIRRFYGRRDEVATEQDSPPVSPGPLELISERTRTVPSSRHRFEIPRPISPLPAITTLSVTAFRHYLACPYRFYLRHVLKLKCVEADALEMTRPVFGSFLHDVLAAFGNHPAAQSEDEQVIRDALMDLLNETSQSRFGADPLPVVKVQLEQVRQRLQAFAVWQTIQAQDGWLIHAVERPHEMPWGRAGKVRVCGNIDRIDRHRDGRFRILDYKSGDTAKSPKEVHLKGDEWIDLQLPLYRQLAARNGLPGELEVGYVCMAKEVDEPKLKMATWSEEEFAAADEVSLDIVDRVLRGEFLPMSQDVVTKAAEFARICQERTRGGQEEVTE